ncbi:arylamine N-acetyltransferase family protein [Priestia koreensis]|uniref:arylamine N-acetyltransferase family protein n=1 Tax=Priestia koreensis TaxID=284581 RepID=UPI0020411B9A|nr:arylamine N-acetyltransferase [Priestia koreensis]MCM3004934.1 arylamine N-acetyltransferase [Priestia koreensis]
MDVQTYLDRFHAAYRHDVSFEYLSYLQEQHMLHVPFENLDVINHVPIVLDLERFYDKVVRGHRGGFCYELNSLFCTLLRELGYEAQLISATVRKPDETWTIAGSHATTLVLLDGEEYIVDVGFGDSVRKPIPLTGGVVSDVSGDYRIVHLEDRTYDFQKAENGQWKTKYRLEKEPKDLLDFTPMCEFNQTSPQSPFTQTNLTTVATENGRITLSGNTLTITTNEKKLKQHIPSEHLKGILDHCFHIDKVPVG